MEHHQGRRIPEGFHYFLPEEIEGEEYSHKLAN